MQDGARQRAPYDEEDVHIHVIRVTGKSRHAPTFAPPLHWTSRLVGLERLQLDFTSWPSIFSVHSHFLQDILITKREKDL